MGTRVSVRHTRPEARRTSLTWSAIRDNLELALAATSLEEVEIVQGRISRWSLPSIPFRLLIGVAAEQLGLAVAVGELEAQLLNVLDDDGCRILLGWCDAAVLSSSSFAMLPLDAFTNVLDHR